MRLGGWARNAALAFASLLACAVLLEIGARLAGYQALYSVYSKPELFWRYDALLGWSHTPSSSGTYVGPRPFPIEYQAEVHINALGLRGPELAARPPGGLRVLVLGDSLAAGFEVADDRTFSALLEPLLTAELGVPVQVINAAVRGYGTDQAYLYYRDRGKPLEPDLVLLMFCGNDFEDNTTLHRARRPFGKPAFSLHKDGSLQLVGYPTADFPMCSAYRLDPNYEVVRMDGILSRAACRAQMALSDHSAFLTFVSMRINRIPGLVRAVYGLGTPDGQTASAAGDGGMDFSARLTSALVRQFASEVAESGAGFTLIGNKSDLDLLGQPILANPGIQILHMDEAADMKSEEMHFKNDLHFTEKGHRAIAEYLATNLARGLATRRDARK